MTNWFLLDSKEIEKKIKTDFKTGLDSSDISILQKKHGRNVFKEKRTTGIFGKIFNQFKSPLILILLLAGFTTIVLGEYTDSFVIFLALFINTVIGTFQENKASQAFAKLSKSQQKRATVIRDGRKSLISASDLVVGDIVILEAGMYVPADIRLFEEKNILINESVLTGEWVGVPKNTKTVKDETNLSLSKQINMVWMGTFVSGGSGRGVVVEIGDKTEIGKVAKSLNEIEEEKTPIKENIEKLAHALTIVIIIALVFIFALGVFRGETILEMVLVSIAVAIAVMPEGLPAAVTSVLALGMWRILQRGGLVRNLLAAETLGSTTVILTDKTGTLTEAKMKLVEMLTAESLKTGDLNLASGDNKEALRMAVLSSDAFIEEVEDAPDKLTVRGRPIEKAIVLAGLEAGYSQEDFFNDSSKRLDILPFESKNGFSASLIDDIDSKKNKIFVSGNPELILDNSSFVYHNGKKKKITESFIESLKKIQKQKSAEGMRFTALAYKTTSWEEIPAGKKDIKKEILEDLVFVGFLVFNDPVRKDVEKSIKIAEEAGARVIMVTGDNPNTAVKIAQEVGIIKKGDRFLIGSDIEKMNDAEVLEELKIVKVFARMVPSQKLRLLKILQRSGEVVAMTGDGINDAPALQGADIGVAVANATEVAKEASDIILLDSDFSVITYAIREGRRIVDNLKKITAYLLSTSFGEVFLIGGALLMGAPLPILPGQILWANIIEEGLMNFAFVFEPGEKDLMKRNPRESKTTTVLTGQVKKMISIISVITGAFLLVLYFILLQFDLDIKEVRTIMFVTLSIDSIFFALSLKSLHKPIWRENIFSNMFLIVSLLISIFFLLFAMFFPPVRNILSLTTLTHIELLFLGGVGLFNLFVIEIVKYFVFEKK